MRPLRPALWRRLGIAHRAGYVERSTQHVVDVLWDLRLAWALPFAASVSSPPGSSRIARYDKRAAERFHQTVASTG